ncbi:MAG: type I DNA topoisomerase, partial [Bacteroidota bacterium]
MAGNVVIVESPAKAKTIEKFLGKDFQVKSSYGHIRDLCKKNYGIDIENDYDPQYEISPEKQKVVGELKKAVKDAEVIWLASDEDREGEAIAWHLAQVLNLPKDKTRRIVFHEITKDAILKAIEQPRNIDLNLVNAQQARRVVDRLVGFELSPVLWKKVKPQLSAGRVQSVAVRLIVEREREIEAFVSTGSYKVTASFDKSGKKLRAELPENVKKREEVMEFFNSCINAKFSVADVTKKPSVKTPAPPFTTSTLQQEASRKLGFSVSKTMTIAQKLYESGKITYMRTDSVNLSDLALNTIRKEVTGEFGEKYYKRRTYKTKTKGAQEAHEAIRPTFVNVKETGDGRDEQRLYELIWKRTIASQMSEAQIEKTIATIDISTSPKKLQAVGEVIIFDGFLKVYTESRDEDTEDDTHTDLPALKSGEILNLENMLATQKFTHHLPRYTEASLVRKLEELGIGRPSTYAPTISTIQTRGYVVKEDRKGAERIIDIIELKDNSLNQTTKKENFGYEKAKMFPTDIGMIVNDFLMKYFLDIMDYNFTANIERQFDDIAIGKMEWVKMVDTFYRPFHDNVDKTVQTSERSVGERLLGTDPVSGKNVYVKIGKFGPIAQIGNMEDSEKPRFAALRKNQQLGSISLEDALELFKLPRIVGSFEDEEIIAGIGKFGPYLRHGGKFYSINKDAGDPLTIEVDKATEIIIEKRQKEKEKVIRIF